MRSTREAEVADLHHPQKDAVMIFVTTHNTPVRSDAGTRGHAGKRAVEDRDHRAGKVLRVVGAQDPPGLENRRAGMNPEAGLIQGPFRREVERIAHEHPAMPAAEVLERARAKFAGAPMPKPQPAGQVELALADT